jgi:prephenate dehydrogenase
MVEDGFFTRPSLANARVAILGLGLMGGSLALALRGRCAALYGIDPDPAVRALALDRQVVERVSGRPEDLLPEANVIILAAPVHAILAMLKELPRWHPDRAFVLDLGSTKVQICGVMETLPRRFDALGGHPMCGREKTGLANADPGLFNGAAFALCPLERASDRLLRFAVEMVQVLGAHPVWMEAAVHDCQAAATSHLPYLTACALALSTPLEAKSLVGPGFRSTTRVAATAPGIMVDILETNRAEILAALERLRSQLLSLETDLRQGNVETLRQRLAQAAAWQQTLVE